MQEEEVVLPTAEQVAARMLCRAAVRMRADVEEALVEDPHEPDALEFLSELRAWANETLDPWLEQSEREMLEPEAGAMSERDRIDASWAVENVGVLAWSLGFIELADYEQTFGADDVSAVVYIGAEPSRIASESVLRPDDEIEAMARKYETIAWRLRCLLDEDGRSESALEYARKLMGRARDLGDLPPLVDGDLPIAGVAAADADEETCAAVMSTAFERLHTLNWLGGQDPSWDQVTADTLVSWLWDQAQS